MENENRYVYAIMKIPILLKKNNEFELLNDYMKIDIAACDKLPKKNTEHINYADKIRHFIDCNNNANDIYDSATDDDENETRYDDSGDEEQQQEEGVEITLPQILKSEIKQNQNKQKINTTFKNHRKNKHRFSVRR